MGGCVYYVLVLQVGRLGQAGTPECIVSQMVPNSTEININIKDVASQIINLLLP